MIAVRRPVLSLIVCLALAVNLMVPVAAAFSFIEICSGHRTVLVPAPDAPEPEDCRACLACCAALASPVAHAETVRAVHAMSTPLPPAAPRHAATVSRHKARAPPLPTSI